MKDVERAAYYVDTKLVSLQFCNDEVQAL